MVETRIVTDPIFRSEVELTDALKDGLRELECRGEVTPMLTRQTDWWRRPQFVMAASFAFIALGLISFLFYQQREPLSVAVVTETLHFEQVRGGGPQADVVWKRAAAPIRLEMHFDVGAEPADTYRVTIERTTDGTGPSLDSVVSTSSVGDVVVAVDGALFEPGDYEIRLEPQPSVISAQNIDYTLAVTR